jgi:hypothetical protein
VLSSEAVQYRIPEFGVVLEFPIGIFAFFGNLR